MDMLRLHDNDSMVSGMDPYFSPLTSPALERGFPQNDPHRSQSMISFSSINGGRRHAESMADIQRSVRRAPYSPVARATVNRKRNSISHLNLNNATGSQSEQSSDSVSPEPLTSGSMPPPPPRNSSSTKLSDQSFTNARQKKSAQRQKRSGTSNLDVAPATPASFLNMTLQNSEQRHHNGPESTITFDHSTDTSPATVKSASSTPTFGPTSAGPSLESPSFISIPSSFDPNGMVSTPTMAATPGMRQMRRPSRGQSRSSSSSPAFKPTISPNLKPLLPGGTSSFYLVR